MSVLEPKFGEVFQWINSKYSDPIVMYVGPSIEGEWGAHPGWYGIQIGGYALTTQVGEGANWAPLGSFASGKHWEWLTDVAD